MERKLSLTEAEKESYLPESCRGTYSSVCENICLYFETIETLLRLSSSVDLIHGLSLQVFRESLQILFRSDLHLFEIRFVSFDTQFSQESFWTKIPAGSSKEGFTSEDVPLIFSRKTNHFQLVNSTQILAKLGVNEGSDRKVIKYNSRGWCLFFVFGSQQYLLTGDQISDESKQILQDMVNIYRQNDISELEQHTFSLAQSLNRAFRKIFSNVLKKSQPHDSPSLEPVMREGVITVHNNVLLSAFLSHFYVKSMMKSQFFGRMFSKLKSLLVGFRYVLLKDGAFLFQNNLINPKTSVTSLGSINSQEQIHNVFTDFKQPNQLSKITFKDILETLKVNSKTAEELLVKATKDGNYTSVNKSWSMFVDSELHTIEFIMSKTNNRKGGVIRTDNAKFLALLKKNTNVNVETTIGMEFLPETQNIKRVSDRMLTKITKLKSEKNIKVKEKSDVKILKVTFLTNPITEILEQTNKHSFNILNYDHDMTCTIIFQMIMLRHGHLDLDELKLETFIRKVGYYYEKNNNAFHNLYHAFTVFHGADFISQSKRFQIIFSSDVSFIFAISALCHDLSHTGFTNIYQEKTESKLANRYGDRSILENYSIAKALKLLSSEETNFIKDLKTMSWKHFRRLLVNAILATDNKNHMLILNNLETHLQEENLNEDATDHVIGALLHCCDFWGSSKEFTVSKKWSSMINSQFHKQYIKEQELGLEQTPYFKDLDQVKVIAKNEQFFIAAIVYPLYEKINLWCEGYLQPMLDNMDENKVIWKQIENGEREETMDHIQQIKATETNEI